jgi:hypothetical protein
MNVKGLLLGTILGTLATSSCTHLVLRHGECPDRPELTVRSAICWEHVTGKTNLSGTIVRVSTLSPVQSAQIVLSSLSGSELMPKSRTAISDSSGSIAIDSVQPGKYLLLIRRIGYKPASDTVVMVADSTVIIRGVLAVESVMLDGCGYAYFEKRVPWWIRK